MTDQRHVDLHAALAPIIPCTLDDVANAFNPLALDFNLWAAERSETGAAKKEAAQLRKLAKELDRVPGHDLSLMRDELLARASAAEHFTHPKAPPDNTNRRNRARVVAECVAILFQAKGANLGAGMRGDGSGEPSGPYGRAVKAALSVFDMNENWFQPAKDAKKRVLDNNN